MTKDSIGFKVEKKKGERILAIVNKLGLLDKTLQIQKADSEHLFVPITHVPDSEEFKILRDQFPEIRIDTFAFLEKNNLRITFTEFLKGKIDPNLLSSLPRALDIVGDIAIIEIPPNLESYRDIIGKAIMKTNRNIRVVLAKAGAVSGTYRLREFDFVAGEHRTNTLYKEYSCSYYVDVAKAYFSPRLSHEHQRVASIVQNGETIVDLFAGVGPFAVLIAKEHKEAKIFGVDINSEAIRLLEKNARLNRVEDHVFPIVGDARKVVEEKLSGVADRVIMNLPETAHEFIDVACKAVKSSGGIVHFYSFVRLPEDIIDIEKRFRVSVEKNHRKVDSFIYANRVRETAPYEWQVVLDAAIS